MTGKDIQARLRHLVSLNEPHAGGPYQGYAAEQCMKAMSEAADALDARDATIARLERELGEAMEALGGACAQMLASYRTWVADDSDAHPKPGQIPRYDHACAVLGKLNGASS